MDNVKQINKPRPGKKHICIIAEGSYPYITGGVSSWVHDIISGLQDFDFTLFAIMAEDLEIKYKLPDNVISLVTRNLTESAGQRSRHKPGDNFFNPLKEFHQGMIEKNDFRMLHEIIRIVHDNGYSYSRLAKNRTSWDMICHYGKQNNPLYAFSDYFWAWRSSHEYMLKMLTWPIPEADLYHTISTGYAGFFAALARIFTGKPAILTEHGLYNKEREIDIKRSHWVKGYQRDLWINIFNAMSTITYQNTDCIISLFEYNRRIQIAQGADEKKTMVIPNGIDIARFADLKKETRKEFSVGLIGRVVPIKDVKTYIIAAKIVVSKIPDAKFYVIGPTDEEPDYHEECVKLVESLKLNDNFVFTGKADVREYYSFLDVVVLSSIREAQPLVILEAYCAGIPAVSTRVGNVPELLDFDENIMADPKDGDKLASGIIKLYEDKAYRNRLISKNRDKVNKFYDKRDLVNKYNSIYNNFIEKGQVRDS